MPRPPRTAWALLCLLFVACSAITDFDRDKLSMAANPNEARDGGPGSSSDTGMDAEVVPREDSGSTPQTDSATGPGPADDGAIIPIDDGAVLAIDCKSHADCPRTRLCCGGSCVVTTPEVRCTECEARCEGTTANACNDRVCGCGANGACTGDRKFCTGNGRDAVCAQCRDAEDCGDRGDGRTQCIKGNCAACDPADNSGCSGTTPTCNPTTFTCEACKATPRTCPGTQVCTASGACGGCTANDAVDCTSATTPICNLAVNPSICRGCESDTECMTELSRPFCVGNQRCSICNPTNDMGCNATSATPDCRLNASGVYQCQGCNATSCGTGLRCNTTSGKCVQCRDGNDCDANSATPFCDAATGTCRGCNAGTGIGGNAWCSLNTLLTRPVCHTTGRCVRCDGAANGCTSPQRCLVDPAPQNNQCVECRPGVAGDCAGGMICGPNGRCRGCTAATENQDCPANSANPACDATTGRCVPCSASRGCSGGNGSCKVEPGNAGMNRCVDCTGTTSGECGGQTPVCDVGRNTCVPCLVQGNAGCTNQICIPGGNTSQNRCGACATADDCRAMPCQTVTCPAGACVYAALPTNDAFSCTDGACSGGTIVQTPIHSRCSNMCVTAMCLVTGGATETGCGPATQTVVCEGGAACNPNTGCPPPVPPVPATP